MKEEEILDHVGVKADNGIISKIQGVEFLLIGLYSLLLLFRSGGLNNIESVVIIFCFLIMAFQAIRIFFEYKEEVITGFGIFLKIILWMGSACILLGMLFFMLKWEGAMEMFTVSLLTLSYPYIIYALCLSKVLIKSKLLMTFSGIAAGMSSVGVLFKIQSWAGGSESITSGYILMILSVVGLVYLLKNNPTKKERYHILSYLGRAVVILLLGLIFVL